MSTKTTAKKKIAKKQATKKTATTKTKKQIAKKTTEPKQATPSAPAKKTVGRDAFGGRVGTRMSLINRVVIDAGKEGANVYEVAEQTKESASVVGAQLGWMVSAKGVATRTKETTESGKRTFRYFAKLGD